MLPPKRSTRSARTASRSIEVDSSQADVHHQRFNQVKLPAILPRPVDVRNDAQFINVLSAPPWHDEKQFAATDSSRKRTRRKLTAPQRLALEDLASRGHNPSLQVRRALAEEVGLELKVVSVWFQNKRRPSSKFNGGAQISPSESRGTRRILRDVNGNTASHESSLCTSGTTGEAKLEATPNTPADERKDFAGIWDFLPSSPGLESEASQSEPSRLKLENMPQSVGLQKRHPSLEWACLNDKRMAKRSRTGSSVSVQASQLSPAITTAHSPRQRTDKMPQSPSAVTLKKDSSIHTNRSRTRAAMSSRSLGDQPRVEEDILDVALALIQLKGQQIPQLTRKSV